MNTVVSYIENLQKRPEHIRRKAAFWWALGITAVVFAFWVATFSFNGDSVRSSAAAVASNVSSPASSLVAGTGALANDIWRALVGPKKVSYSQQAEVQVVPGND